MKPPSALGRRQGFKSVYEHLQQVQATIKVTGGIRADDLDALAREVEEKVDQQRWVNSFLNRTPR